MRDYSFINSTSGSHQWAAGYKEGWEAAKADSNNHNVLPNRLVVEYDLAPALVESKLHDKLVELGWSPPGSGVKYYYEAPDKTCRCGLNPSGCNMGCDV